METRGISDTTGTSESPSLLTPSPKIPTSISEARFDCLQQNILTDDDNLYRIVARNISYKEFDDFYRENDGAQIKYEWRDSDIVYQLGNESAVPIREFAASYLAGLAYGYNYRLGRRVLVSQGTTRQDVPGLSRQPDFSFQVRRPFFAKSRNGNLIGEIMYSHQSLSSGHENAQRYLGQGSNICGVILVKLPFPWPVDPATGRFLPDGKVVYLYYERSPDIDGNIAPTVVKSFGTIPLDDDDIADIAATVHCSQNTITGFTVHNMVHCDAANNQAYMETIPGRVLLVLDPVVDDHVDLLDVGRFPIGDIPPEYDMQINLFEVQEAISSGIDHMRIG